MKFIILATCILLAACDDKTISNAPEDTEYASRLYEECHKHLTYGAHIGGEMYCLVPLARMKEMK